MMEEEGEPGHDYKCFHCGAAAVTRHVVNVTNPWHDDWISWGKRGCPEEKTPVQITICACVDHDAAVMDWIMTKVDGYQSFNLVWPEVPKLVYTGPSRENPAYQVLEKHLGGILAKDEPDIAPGHCGGGAA